MREGLLGAIYVLFYVGLAHPGNERSSVPGCAKRNLRVTFFFIVYPHP